MPTALYYALPLATITGLAKSKHAAITIAQIGECAIFVIAVPRLRDA